MQVKSMSRLLLIHILAILASNGSGWKVVQRCKLSVDVQCPSQANPTPVVSCSTQSCKASGESSWYIGSVYDTKKCLTEVNLMIKIDYVKGSGISCSLVPLVSEAQLLETYSTLDACAQNALGGNISEESTPVPIPTALPTDNVMSAETPVISLAPFSCPVGWHIFESSCFQVTETRGSYGQGYDYCTQNGGNLASIRSEAENNFISTIVTETTWFGLSDGFTEGEFFWADGTLLTYEHWNAGEPNNFLDAEDCTVIGPESLYMWNDERCDAIFPFLCRMSAL